MIDQDQDSIIFKEVTRARNAKISAILKELRGESVPGQRLKNIRKNKLQRLK